MERVLDCVLSAEVILPSMVEVDLFLRRPKRLDSGSVAADAGVTVCRTSSKDFLTIVVGGVDWLAVLIEFRHNKHLRLFHLDWRGPVGRRREHVG